MAKVCADFPDEYWLKQEEKNQFPFDFHRALAAGGWLGICMPPQYGGSGLGIAEAAVMMQTISESGGGMTAASSVHSSFSCFLTCQQYVSGLARKSWSYPHPLDPRFNAAKKKIFKDAVLTPKR